MTIFNQIMDTPIGHLEVRASAEGVISVLFIEATKPTSANEITRAAVEQLQAYFDGSRTRFDLPLVLSGTEFQTRVWDQLKRIDYGVTRSYKDIAESLSNPKAVRAVGSANGRNPISIVIPCHRVICSNGNLSGYAGGVARKEWLLTHERALLAE